MLKQNDLLDRKTFEKALLDMYLVEGFVRFKIREAHFDSLRVAAMTEMNALYEKHNTQHEQFIESYAYYMNDPDVSAEIMKNLVNQLVELQAKEEARQKAKDSVAIANRLTEKDSVFPVNQLIKTIVKVKAE